MNQFSSTTTITSLPNSSASLPPNHNSQSVRNANNKAEQSSRVNTAAVRAHAAKTARTLSLTAVYGNGLTRAGTAGSTRTRKKLKSGGPRGSSVSEDGVKVATGKTAAQLKSSKSKKFVESVWTKEFCKLMDMRLYSH